MTDLIQRIEAAKEPSKGYFTEAAKALWGWEGAPEEVDPDFWVARWVHFNKVLDAQAWTSAAEMLVPEGWGYSLHNPSVPDPDNAPSARTWGSQCGTFQAYAAHPSLALLAAILRAERKDDE